MGHATPLSAFDLPANSGSATGSSPRIGVMPSSANVRQTVVTTHSSNPPPDEQALLLQLLARMAQGEQQALAALYDQTVSRVYGFANRLVHNAGAAEEIASDVYLQAWRGAAKYDPLRSKVLTWLLMICRSRALDWLRARETAEVLHDAPETLAEETASPGGSPHDLLEAVQSGHALHQALAKLPPVQRQLLGLAFFRGLSHQEIAEQARLPLGTVKSHIRRAVDTLRAHLGVER